MQILVGYTGFVGSNLYETMKFDKVFNSKNIKDSFGLNPDLLIYAGVTGTKFLANQYPQDDLKIIENAKENILKINPKKLVLISSVDVYDDLEEKNEDYIIDPSRLHTYGKNRYELEQWVIKNIKDFHIVRLPAIYGENLKKNYIHDLINPCPTFITESKFHELLNNFEKLSKYYKREKDYYRLTYYDKCLISFFQYSKDNALHFTDSKSSYQYFNLKKLYLLIQEVIEKNISIINVVTPPIESAKLYYEINEKKFKNEITKQPIKYNLKTKYDLVTFKNKNGYLLSEKECLDDLVCFIREERNKL